MMYKIDQRPDMGTFPTKREALYWVHWLLRATGTRYRVVAA